MSGVAGVAVAVAAAVAIVAVDVLGVVEAPLVDAGEMWARARRRSREKSRGLPQLT